jgi:hypothetical protein
MKKLMDWATRPECIWWFGGIGDVLLIIGIITAAAGKSFGTLAPAYWLVLAFAFYLYMFWVLLMRILAALEKKG